MIEKPKTPTPATDNIEGAKIPDDLADLARHHSKAAAIASRALEGVLAVDASGVVLTPDERKRVTSVH